MDKSTGCKSQSHEVEKTFKSYFKAIDSNNTTVSCDNCTYGQQDIDTYPCAKCHTRH